MPVEKKKKVPDIFYRSRKESYIQYRTSLILKIDFKLSTVLSSLSHHPLIIYSCPDYYPVVAQGNRTDIPD